MDRSPPPRLSLLQAKQAAARRKLILSFVFFKSFDILRINGAFPCIHSILIMPKFHVE